AAGLPAPAGIVALSPWADFDSTARLGDPAAATEPYLAPQILERVIDRHARRFGRPHPSHCPMTADLRGLPPTLIQASSIEVLRRDAEGLAHRLAAAGVRTRLQLWADQVHVFQIATGLVPEATAAIDEIGRFALEVTGAGPSR
ncbi:MAG: alpha/beta hydrolase fold domain-containing protein, partial [Solirubrobacteraceae bacterium]